MEKWDISIVNQTDKDLKDYEIFINDLVVFAFNYLKIKDCIELAIILVDNNQIQQINKKYRNIDSATDVISFALEDEPNILSIDIPRCLGDIFISVNKIENQAKKYQHSFERELAFLVVHGLLHLLGYDHQTEHEEQIMFDLQEEILNEANIKRSN